MDKKLQLTPVQMKLIEGLLEGKTVAAAALAAGCSKRVAFYWLRAGDVRDAYELAREQALSDFQSELRELRRLTLSAMKDVLKDAETPPYVRLGVMKMVYESSFSPDLKVGQAPRVVDALNDGAREYYEDQQKMSSADIALYDDRGRPRIKED